MKKKILQISDIHIGSKEEAMGIDVRSNFQNCLKEGMGRGVDALIITGDLCLKEGTMETYHWIRQILDGLEVPWFVLPGNHDDSAMMSEAFSLQNHYHCKDSEFYQVFQWEQRTFFLLDTAKGDLSEVQRSWLVTELKNQDTSIPPLIFMHHPPIHLSVPHMDEMDIPSPDTQRFIKTLKTCESHVHVFVGHYHADKIVQMSGMTVWACPSTYYQMSQSVKEFSIEDLRPGYRLIEIQPDRILVNSHFMEV
jgi:Icc protein